jgi:hypothetical protein
LAKYRAFVHGNAQLTVLDLQVESAPPEPNFGVGELDWTPNFDEASGTVTYPDQWSTAWFSELFELPNRGSGRTVRMTVRGRGAPGQRLGVEIVAESSRWSAVSVRPEAGFDQRIDAQAEFSL